MTNRLLVLLLHKQLHQSWLIAVSCVAIVLGVAIARQLPIGAFSSYAWLMTGIAMVIFGLIRSKVWVIVVVLVLCGGFLIGVWRGSAANVSSTLYDHLIGKSVVMTGVVNEDTDINQRGQTVLRIRNIAINGHKISGLAWATIKRFDNVRRSDQVRLRGKLSTGFGTFNATMYDAKLMHVQRPKPGDIALEVRDWFGDGVRKAINEPQSSLGLGYLLGQRRGLPPKLDTALKAAGLTHIVVASGYNLTILVRLARHLFERVSKYTALLSSTVMIAAFIGITGLSPSMSRAGLVAGLSLLAWYYGRRFHPLVLLPFTMAITVLIQPSYAWEI
jgi:competence protein ComEC